jgi:hypothetical protein
VLPSRGNDSTGVKPDAFEDEAERFALGGGVVFDGAGDAEVVEETRVARREGT